MVVQGGNLLGIGLYTPSEAARYARISVQMMNRWVHGNAQGEPVVHASFGGEEKKVVTFVDFVQSIAIRQLRKQTPTPSLQKIRLAYDEAVSTYQVQHPFAHRHECFYDGKNIWIKLPWTQNREGAVFTQVTGRGRGQAMIREVAQIYIDRIKFSGDDHIASAFTLYHDELGEITMNPDRHFGEPTLPSGYALGTIVNAYHNEGDVITVADSYEIPKDEVILALRCDDFLDLRTAA